MRLAPRLASISTAALLDLVIAAGYEGSSWEALNRRLIPYALSDLARSIANGTIHSR